MSAPFPWQAAQWARIGDMHAQGRLPHAILLTGPHGIGKDGFARALARALLCTGEDWDARPCGTCRGCRLVAAGSHPDLDEVVPEEGKRSIGIDVIRELIGSVSLTSSYAGRKVVLLARANLVTREGANTLLKTLEEPPGDTVFLLVAAQASMLPATVRSRCQVLRFAIPDRGASAGWLSRECGGDDERAEQVLRIARGAPLSALELAREDGLDIRNRLLADLSTLARPDGDPIAIADGWREVGRAATGYWLGSLVEDLIRLRSGGGLDALAHTDRGPAMQALVPALDLRALFDMFDRCLDARWVEAARLNVNEQLLLEGLARQWQRCSAR